MAGTAHCGSMCCVPLAKECVPAVQRSADGAPAVCLSLAPLPCSRRPIFHPQFWHGQARRPHPTGIHRCAAAYRCARTAQLSNGPCGFALLSIVPPHRAGCPAGVGVAPHFDRPWAATSLADFWSNRWDLVASNQLRNCIYSPIMEGAPRIPAHRIHCRGNHCTPASCRRPAGAQGGAPAVRPGAPAVPRRPSAAHPAAPAGRCGMFLGLWPHARGPINLFVRSNHAWVHARFLWPASAAHVGGALAGPPAAVSGPRLALHSKSAACPEPVTACVPAAPPAKRLPSPLLEQALGLAATGAAALPCNPGHAAAAGTLDVLVCRQQVRRHAKQPARHQ